MSEMAIDEPNGLDEAAADRIEYASLPAFLSETRGLERDYIGEVLKSRRAAWRVAGVMTGLALAGLGAGAAALWQPPVPPLVLRVDNATGAVEQVTALRTEESYGEVVDAYWLNRYVLDRESYDWQTVQVTYDATALMSAPDVQGEFQKLYGGMSGRDIVLGNKARIVVEMRSIQLVSKGRAVLRFSTRQTADNGVAAETRTWIATVAYLYASAPMRVEDRRINPLGFQVTSYRVDPETVTGKEGRP